MHYILPEKSFYLQDTLTLTKELLGKYLIRKIEDKTIAARINEAESYIGPIDKACHAYNYKKTERTKVIFENGGIAYIYLIYGMYYCLNVVAEKEGTPCAVLIRGADIVLGENEAANLRYNKNFSELNKNQVKNISNGPGKLCKALNINKELNACDLSKGELLIASHIEGVENPEFSFIQTPRIGIDYAEEAKDFPWRFVLQYSNR